MDRIHRIPRRLLRFGQVPKRFKIAIGGRGSGKSESVASIVSARVWDLGCRAVCCREYQTSIKQSVHSLVSRKIKEMGLGGYHIGKSEIAHDNGGEIIYQGLNRDPQAIKSVDEARVAWVEEAQSLSDESIAELTPSIRAAGSEIFMTANLGSSLDPFSQRFIKPFERQLRAKKYYEDDLHLIVWINFDENPWFPEELERERKHDLETLSPAAYAHKWLGEFSDEVENAIIEPTWFDSAINAHERLGFRPEGLEVVSHDPSDGGDNKTVVYRHGVVTLDVKEEEYLDVNRGAVWASNFALEHRPDVFVWDADGLGLGLRMQFAQAFQGKHTRLVEFRGGSSPNREHENVDPEHLEGEPNRKVFKNLRAQAYWELRERFRKTHLAVNGKYTDPEELISLSQDIEILDLLRSEVCGVPQKLTTGGIFQMMSKAEMKLKGMLSPNLADALMMSYNVTDVSILEQESRESNYSGDYGWLL